MAISLQQLAHPTTQQELTLRVRETLTLIINTGDVVGVDDQGRTIIQLAVDEIQLDDLAAFGAELDDLEPESLEDDHFI